MRTLIATGLALVLLSGSAFGQTELASDFPVIGSVEPRHATEIIASNWSVGAETMDRDYTIYETWKEHLGPLGIKKARIQAGWAKTEPEKGVYNWAWLDEIIHDMDRQGVEPWVNLSYGNPVYLGGGGTRLGATLLGSEEAREGWLRWVKAIVNRYEGVVDEWEVWNEPVHGENSAEAYADLLVETAEMIRSVQPDAKILAMAMAGIHPEHVQVVFDRLEKEGKLHLIDEVTYHPYRRNPDAVYDKVAALRAMIHRYSDEITIRQGENGAPSEYRETKALSGYEWTELSQAKWALRRLLGDLGRDVASSYFAIMDMKYPDEMNRKGLLHARDDKTVGHRKPAYFAVQHLTAIFDHTLVRMPSYSRATSSAVPLSVFGYEKRASGAQVVTIWDDGDVPSDSNTKTAVDFTFYEGQFADPVYVDLRTGQVYDLPEDNRSVEGTVYRFENIPVYDSPILIADRSAIPVQEE